MRRTVFLAAVLLAFAATVGVADDKATRERKVRVALALAVSTQSLESCGQCREDVTEARADALRDGKPVVLFVGGCPGGDLASAACAGGGIPVKTTQYAGDDRPSGEKRVVILEPKADRSGFLRVDVPKGTDAKELKEKVKASVPKVVKPESTPVLNWNF